MTLKFWQSIRRDAPGTLINPDHSVETRTKFDRSYAWKTLVQIFLKRIRLEDVGLLLAQDESEGGRQIGEVVG